MSPAASSTGRPDRPASEAGSAHGAAQTAPGMADTREPLRARQIAMRASASSDLP